MTVPYLARLVCLSMAAFFLAHLVLSAIVCALAGRAIERAGRMRPRDGARLLLWLRLAPAAIAGTLVLGVCAPSYFWLEPEAEAEHLGIICLGAAALGVVACGLGIARAARAAVRSSRYLRNCERAIDTNAPVLMLAGVFHSRLVVSRGVRRALTFDQLAVAMRHECAHRASRDNLKRLLIIMTPDVIPFVRGLGRLEHAWSRLAEWAADDRAVGGNRRRSLSLAAALVRVARMGTVPAVPLVTSLLGDGGDLSERVERLLAGAAPHGTRTRSWPAIAVTLAIAALAVQPATFVTAHRVLEILAH